MKLKKLTAALLSAATVLTMAQFPLPVNPFAKLQNEAALTAQAAGDTVVAYQTVNSAMYMLYTNGKDCYAKLLTPYSNITTLTIPEYISYNHDRFLVRRIESSACKGHSSLKTVDMSSAYYLEEIGDWAFGNITSLTEVKMSNAVTKIGASAFQGDKNLKTCNMSTRLVSIGNYAFCETAISGTVSFGPSLRDINSTVFSSANNISAYSVSSSNTYLKTVDGVLYNRTGDTLILYPPKKASTSYTVTSKYIQQYAFNKTPALKTLNISKSVFSTYYCNSATWEFPALTTLTIPASDYSTYCKNGDLKTLSNKYARFFWGSKLLTVNGKTIVAKKSSGEPYFTSEYEQYIYDHFDEMTYPYFMMYYRDKMLDYVYNSVITSSMTDMQKAVRLHEWICRKVSYDPTEQKYWDYKAQDKTPDESWKTNKNHHELSIFLHKVGSNYYTVCEGYAKGYELLLKRAGIEDVYCVSGSNKTKESLGGHEWNLVKLSGKYYHIDVCWDDTEYDLYMKGDTSHKNYYRYFMKTDTDFTNDGHGAYDWQKNSYNTANNAIRNSLGDVNLDQHLGTMDKTMLSDYVNNGKQFYSNTTNNNKAKKNADANLDGKINQTDLNVVSNALSSKYYTVFEYLVHSYEKNPTNA